MEQPRPGDKRFQVLNYVGIIDQLITTRANRMLAAEKLPLAQFSMLNHFSHDPKRGRTVSETAGAFEAPQPGITKMFQRLVRKGYLAVKTAPEDARIKRHFLTAKGQAARRRAIARLMPDIARMFAEWPPDELDALHGALFRLKVWLDRDRDPPPKGKPRP